MDPAFLTKCHEDADANEPLAAICLRTLMTYSSRLPQLRKMLFKMNGTVLYWMPCAEMRQDPYLATL